jgi:ribonuclease III
MKELFNNKALFELAMTHCGNINLKNNQRLEFLGDRVLSLLVADMLYQHFPEANEGDLSRRHAALVRGETVAQIADEIGLKIHINLSHGDESLGVRDNFGTLEDACEALIGALFIDGGIEKARIFVEKYWRDLLNNLHTAPKDAKTSLQELVQSIGLNVPNYILISTEGAAHSPIFTVEATVENMPSSLGQAKSKRSAEQIAAQNWLNDNSELIAQLKENNHNGK